MSNQFAIDCACRVTHKASEADIKHLVILTCSKDSGDVRKHIAGALPAGSTNTGAVWTTPDGHTVSIKRYSAPVPAYTRGFTMEVCNGGRPMTQENQRNVQRWRSTSPAPIPFVAP